MESIWVAILLALFEIFTPPILFEFIEPLLGRSVTLLLAVGKNIYIYTMHMYIYIYTFI